MRADWHDVYEGIQRNSKDQVYEGIQRDSADQVYEGMVLDINASEIQENANFLEVATRENRMRESGTRETRRDALDWDRAETP